MAKNVIDEARHLGHKNIGLDDLGLKEVPSGLLDLASLLRVSLSNNKISGEWCLRTGSLAGKLPDDMYRLKNLEALSLYANRLAHLPRSINQLQLLKRLVVRCFGTSPALEYLDLSCNKITTISSNFGLSVLPKEMGNLVLLETVRADSIAVSTDRLVLRDNKLRDLPAEFAKLKALSHLNLQGNLFTTVPLCLLDLHLDRKDSRLLLAGNPLEADTKAALKKGGVARLFSAMRAPGWGGASASVGASASAQESARNDKAKE
ncbi:hypothetical protein BC831DRAFT_511766 [Entophlyctis helioformis]|nr:hypothetical protein BC831DRAFT_511766 [Entophlyctis helioformis]